MNAVLPPEAAGKPVEVRWRDEARVGRQGTPTRVRAERGSRPAAPKDRRHARAHLSGAVRPARGVGAGLVPPRADAEAMNLHLGEIAKEVSPGAHAVLVLDGAGRHQTGGALQVPANISLPHLPPHAPELNPVENLRAFLRGGKPANRVFDAHDAVLDACCDAWGWPTHQPERIAALASRPWARVND